MVALLTSDPIYTLPPERGPRTRRVDARRDFGDPTIARRSRPRHLSPVPRVDPSGLESVVPPRVAVPRAEAAPNEVSPETDAGSLLSSVRTQELVLMGVALMLSLCVLTMFRQSQGTAPVSWSDVAPVAAVPAAVEANEIVIRVESGDTLWGIAAVIAPTADRREVVQKLADRNGGSSIDAGQDLIVPAGVANL